MAAASSEYHPEEVSIVTGGPRTVALAGCSGDGPTTVETGIQIPIVPVQLFTRKNSKKATFFGLV